MVYLDNNATTPLDPSVAEKMSAFLKEHFGNPSSLYPIGRQVKEMINEAREYVAQAQARPNPRFISRGPALNPTTMLSSACSDAHPDKKELVISAIEHPAVRRGGHLS